ncbi:hypothetical protein BJ508DRAFT_92280 [Ascobolus immersus RN42]|uniref:Uncharacterized protein n=1 Tax=Ascobolus immersus RN42 TaxID=1160509 RepID=A0A3N4HCH0_ASCIM|nr:hypothetical protein BJ508DRAFT_92280 [Ascobolus immersus RN42]
MASPSTSPSPPSSRRSSVISAILPPSTSSFTSDSDLIAHAIDLRERRSLRHARPSKHTIRLSRREGAFGPVTLPTTPMEEKKDGMNLDGAGDESEYESAPEEPQTNETITRWQNITRTREERRIRPARSSVHFAPPYKTAYIPVVEREPRLSWSSDSESEDAREERVREELSEGVRPPTPPLPHCSEPIIYDSEEEDCGGFGEMPEVKRHEPPADPKRPKPILKPSPPTSLFAEGVLPSLERSYSEVSDSSEVSVKSINSFKRMATGVGFTLRNGISKLDPKDLIQRSDSKKHKGDEPDFFFPETWRESLQLPDLSESSKPSKTKSLLRKIKDKRPRKKKPTKSKPVEQTAITSIDTMAQPEETSYISPSSPASARSSFSFAPSLLPPDSLADVSVHTAQAIPVQNPRVVHPPLRKHANTISLPIFQSFTAQLNIDTTSPLQPSTSLATTPSNSTTPSTAPSSVHLPSEEAYSYSHWHSHLHDENEPRRRSSLLRKFAAKETTPTPPVPPSPTESTVSRTGSFVGSVRGSIKGGLLKRLGSKRSSVSEMGVGVRKEGRRSRFTEMLA